MHITITQALGGAHTVFKTPAAAEAIVATLTETGLTYRLVSDAADGSTKTIVEVIDEDGIIIDLL
jgi:hypothetical protein